MCMCPCGFPSCISCKCVKIAKRVLTRPKYGFYNAAIIRQHLIEVAEKMSTPWYTPASGCGRKAIPPKCSTVAAVLMLGLR